MKDRTYMICPGVEVMIPKWHACGWDVLEGTKIRIPGVILINLDEILAISDPIHGGCRNGRVNMMIV